MNESYSKGMISYSSRDYDSLVEEFYNIVPKLTDLWRPEADADPGVVLGKYLASVADMLGVNLDWLANEIYAPSVSQRKNAEKIFGLIGYDLGWYTAARTEVTFTNNSNKIIKLDFGFNGSNFATLNAYTDITDQSRIITYNVLPLTNVYGASDTRSIRRQTTEDVDIFAESDAVELAPGESVTRVAIEGELRYTSISVADVKANNYIIRLPSQHVDTTAVWIRAKTSLNSNNLSTQWRQCGSAAEFIIPEPRFAVTYDNYSNAQVQVSNYLNQLEDYENNYLVIYWIDCSGVIGCVGENVLTNYLSAQPDSLSDDTSNELSISNLSNTVELPHTNVVTGSSPETAKEAYYNSRNYINTWDSLITLPDFNRFLLREPGVDCGLVIDCQKALEINLAIFNDKNLTDSQKSKMYITKYDFPVGDPSDEWITTLHTSISDANPEVDISNMTFNANFKTYTAMCFAIHNDFNDSSWGNGQISYAQYQNTPVYIKYKPPIMFIDNVKRDYNPVRAMSVELEFGYIRLFEFYVVGQIYTKRPVTQDVGDNIISTVREALSLFFAPVNRNMGQKPTVMEVVNVIRNCHSLIDYFDAGSIKNPVINWYKCDEEYFNPISFARLVDPASTKTNIRIAPECLIS